MYDTATNGKLNRIDQITMRLATLNMKTPTAASRREEKRLLSELGQLNREIRIMPPPPPSQRSQVNRGGAAVERRGSSSLMDNDALAIGLFAIIVLAVAVIIYANI